MNDNKITVMQTACLLIISRLVVTLTYTPFYIKKGFSTADLISVLIAAPVVFAEYIPVFFLSKRNRSVLGLAYDTNKVFGHITAILYALFFMFIASVSSARLDIFITTGVFPKSTAAGFILLVVLFASLTALRGIEGNARAATVFFVILAAAVLLLLVSPANQYEALNIVSPFEYNSEGIVPTAVTFIAHSAEAAMLAVLLQNVRGKVIKTHIAYVIVSFLIIAAIIFTVIITVGDYSEFVLFPYYTAASITTIGSFTSLSPLLIAIWFVGVFIKCSFCICLCIISLERLIKKPFITVAASFAVIFSLGCILSSSMKYYSVIFTPGLSLITCIIFTFAVPFTVLLAGGRNNEKN